MIIRPYVSLGAICLALSACLNQNDRPKTSNVPPETQLNVSAPNPLKNAYFGDLHVHTGNSFDAFIFNVKAKPGDAYRFAKGETIKHPGRFDIRLDGPPLDFYAVTDHGEYLGILRAMKDKASPLSKVPLAKEMTILKPKKLRAAFGRISQSTRSGVPIAEINDQIHMNEVWQATIDAANRHYQPGVFTTFAGYEFSSVRARDPENQSIGGNLHRNVIFQNKAPDQLFTTLNSTNPEDLWNWMEAQRQDGIKSLAIPHNSNVSDGHMFAGQTYDGALIDQDYAKARMRNEPLAEITQVKGTSEVHPSQAPNDEWADFEIYEDLLNTQTKSKISGSYIRGALEQGNLLQDKKGFNPFKFGFIGSSDTHVAGSGFTEQNHWGKMGFVDGRPKQRQSVPPRGARNWDRVNKGKSERRPFGKWSASGLAGIWAEENTRESLFGAMRRKETFATSGPRMTVRFFALPEFDPSFMKDMEWITKAYESGVSMGGEIRGRHREKQSPSFAVWAQRDPNAARLDRVQIVKSTGSGSRVYDVTCAAGEPNPLTRRCPKTTYPVDLSTCDIDETFGAAELKTVWQDPDYKDGEAVSYYVRVLQIPTCRWSTWDAVKAGVPPNPEFPATLQERAWSSPIWLSPNTETKQ